MRRATRTSKKSGGQSSLRDLHCFRLTSLPGIASRERQRRGTPCRATYNRASGAQEISTSVLPPQRVQKRHVSRTPGARLNCAAPTVLGIVRGVFSQHSRAGLNCFAPPALEKRCGAPIARAMERGPPLSLAGKRSTGGAAEFSPPCERWVGGISLIPSTVRCGTSRDNSHPKTYFGSNSTPCFCSKATNSESKVLRL